MQKIDRGKKEQYRKAQSWSLVAEVMVTMPHSAMLASASPVISLNTDAP